MPSRPIAVILVSSLITIALWLSSIPSLPATSHSTLNYLSQITANLTVVYMGISLLMTMRMQIIEKFFGGLDKNYRFHALAGSLGFLFMVAHPLTLAIHKLIVAPDLSTGIEHASFYFLPGSRIAANFGISALYCVLFAFTFMTYLKLPYQHWLTTHRVLAIAFLLGSIHAYLAPSQLIRSWPLAVWIGFWIYLGLASAIYSIILFRQFGVHYRYVVSQVEKLGDIFNIVMQPRNLAKDKIIFLPGQFMYLRLHHPRLSAEMHPFSASSDPADNNLRFSIKALGDYTSKVDDLVQAGDSAEIYGPYGNFGSAIASETKPLIWIAGGVGVTPFLSMLHAEKRKPATRPILFYYSVNKPEEAAFDAEISAIVAILPHVAYIKWVAEASGFLTAAQISSDYDSKFNTQDSRSQEPMFLLCGPPNMMHAIQAGLLEQQISADHIIFEEFNFIS